MAPSAKAIQETSSMSLILTIVGRTMCTAVRLTTRRTSLQMAYQLTGPALYIITIRGMVATATAELTIRTAIYTLPPAFLQLFMVVRVTIFVLWTRQGSQAVYPNPP